MRVSRSPHTTAHIARPQQGHHVPKARPGGLGPANVSDGWCTPTRRSESAVASQAGAEAGLGKPLLAQPGDTDLLRTIRNSEMDSRQHTVYTVTNIHSDHAATGYDPETLTARINRDAAQENHSLFARPLPTSIQRHSTSESLATSRSSSSSIPSPK